MTATDHPNTLLARLWAALESAAEADTADTAASATDDEDPLSPRAAAADRLSTLASHARLVYDRAGSEEGAGLCALLGETCYYVVDPLLRSAMLDVATQCLAALVALQGGESGADAPDVPGAPLAPGDLAALRVRFDAVKPADDDAAAIARAMGMTAEEAATFGLTGHITTVGLDDDEEDAPLARTGEDRAVPSAEGATGAWDEAPPESLDTLFRRDAQALLTMELPRALQQYWRNQGSMDALLEVRRAFHTLKGDAAVVAQEAEAADLTAFSHLAESAEDIIDELLGDDYDGATSVPPLPSGAFGLLNEVQGFLLRRLAARAPVEGEEALLTRLEAMQARATASREPATPATENDQASVRPDQAHDEQVVEQVTAAKKAASRLAPTDRLDLRLAQTFLSEADRLAPDLHRALARLSDDAGDESALVRARVKLHTLKGGAALAGPAAASIERLAHGCEDLLEMIEDFQLGGELSAVPTVVLSGMLDAEDALQSLLDDLRVTVTHRPDSSLSPLPKPDVDLLIARLAEIKAQVQRGDGEVVQPVPVSQLEHSAVPAAVTAQPGAAGDAPAAPTEASTIPAGEATIPAPGAAPAAPAHQATRPDTEPDMEPDMEPDPGMSWPSGTESPVRDTARELAAGAPIPLPALADTVPAPRGERRTPSSWGRGQGAARPSAHQGHDEQHAGGEATTESRLGVALLALEDQQVGRDAQALLLRHMSAQAGESRQANVRLRQLVERLEHELADLRHELARVTRHSGEWDALEKEEYSTIDVLLMQLDEALADQQEAETHLRRDLAEARARNEAQADVLVRAQHALLDMSMATLSTLEARLDHAVRSVGRRLGKSVALTLEGGDVALDTRIAESLFNPLMLLINNAIDHGLEATAERVAAGKPRQGHIVVRGRASGDSVAIEIHDDGQGIDPDRVAAVAVSKSLIEAHRAAVMTAEERIALIWEPAFSTATVVGAVSGRGMGMTSVKDDITALQGRIEVATTTGQGTTFTITLPRSLAMMRVQIVREGEHVVGVPITNVVSTHSLPYDSVVEIPGGRVVRAGTRTLSVYPAHLASGPAGDGVNGRGILLEVDGHDGGLLVDDVLYSQYLPVRPAPVHLRRSCGLIGYALGAGGAIVPVLDLATVIDRQSAVGGEPAVHSEEGRARTADHQTPHATVLVVDDSQTMRRALSRTFGRAGFRVREAASGREALALIGREMPDVITLDMEMPGIDGLETLSALRLMHGGATVPVFMVTSRQQARHRAAALAAGVTRYITKPYNDEELIGAARVALAAKAVGAVAS